MSTSIHESVAGRSRCDIYTRIVVVRDADRVEIGSCNRMVE